MLRRLLTYRTIAFAMATLLALFVHAQSLLQVGYAILKPDTDSAVPSATALLRAMSADGVISETSIPAVQPVNSGLLYIDELETRTGLVFVNPSDQSVTVTLQLRDAAGEETASRMISVGPHRHTAQFAAQLFGGSVVNLVGSISFRSDQPVAATALRQNFNARGEAIYTAVPVLDSQTSESASAIIPYVRSVDGYFTTVVVLNRSGQRARGRVQVRGNPPIENSYDIPPNGIQRINIGAIPDAAYAEVTPEPGSAVPDVLAFIQSKFPGGLISETVVPQVAPSPAWRTLVEVSAGTQTQLSLANPSSDPASVTFTLIDRFGATMSTATHSIPPQSLLFRTAGELFSGVSAGFLGQIEVGSSVPVSVAVIRTTETNNNSILTRFPAVDLSLQSAGELVLPYVVIGTEFSIRLVLINRDAQAVANGQIAFLNSDGSPMSIPVPEEVVSGTRYTLDARGSRQLFPGNTTPVRSISLRDPISNQAATELAINEGDAVRPSVFVTDVLGIARDDFKVLLTVTNPNVASIDPNGAIIGVSQGYSTLVIAAGRTIEPYTVTVVGVEDGIPGFRYKNPAGDAAGRLYWTSSEDHTIVLTQDLRQAPAVWAGIPRAFGLTNDVRLASRFNRPSYVAVRANGTIYVSDSNNHVIRQILPGPDGLVSTIAGSGVPGVEDGVTGAAFRNPQGVALDDRGYIWIADSGNHTIRRIHPLTGEVTTVAGQAGEIGGTDGKGNAARFHSPTGIAAEPTPLAAQASRRGQPQPIRMIVADTGNGMIRRVTEDGAVETISQPLSSGLSVQTENGSPRRESSGTLMFNQPVGVAVDAAGTIYVVEEGEVRAVLPNQSVVRVAQAGTLVRPTGIAITNSGRIVISDDQVGPRQIRFGSPQFASVTPGRISSRGGARVTIRGQNFAPETSVILAGTIIRDVQIANTETITFTAPPLESGRTTLTLQNRGGIAQREFTIEPIPIEELPPGSITTLAGGSTFTGDGGPAIEAPIALPEQTAIDAVGNIYIADSGHHRIRKVDHATGVIVTVAGNGDAGFSGDGDLAIAAQLSFPSGIALDGAGDIFISDSGNRRIRKVEAATGNISTFAGPAGNSGSPGATIVVNLNAPRGLTFDAAGNLYVADTTNHRILKITPDAKIITFAGNGQSSFSGDNGPAADAALNAPSMVAMDGSGNLWIADTGNSRIRRIDSAGIIQSIDAGALRSPRGVAAGVNGDVFIADSGNHRILSIRASGGIATVAGNGKPGFSGDGGSPTDASLNDPYGITVDGSGVLVIADRGNNRIRRVAEGEGRLLTPFGVLLGAPTITTVGGKGQSNDLGDNGTATAATLVGPAAVVSDAAGNLYIADSSNQRIRRVDRRTGIISTVAGTGRGGVDGDGIPATEALLGAPQGVAVGADGSLYVADTQNHRIRRIDSGGLIHTFAGTGVRDFSDNLLAHLAALAQPTGLAIDSQGNLYIADSGNHRIRMVAAGTQIMTTLAGNGAARFSNDGGLASEASLASPRGVAVDTAGNVYIADSGNNRIRRVDIRTGIIQTIAGNGAQNSYGDEGPAVLAALSFPLSVAIDRTGAVLVLDSFNQRLRQVQMSSGIIRTIAGTGIAGFSGDNGPATQARMFSPAHVSIDAAGNILIADTVNSRIRGIAVSLR